MHKIIIFTQLALSKIKRFSPQYRLYGFNAAFWSLLFPLYRFFGPFKQYFAVNKHKAILKYLGNRYSSVLKKFENVNKEEKSNIDPKSVIWVSWWDGEETMPPLVRACYNSIKSNSGAHPVKLVTKNNYYNYISIPDYIMDRLNSGNMKITHFSNILRVNLLYEYGGIWLDATILTLKEILLDNFSFFTLKSPDNTVSCVSHTRWQGLSDFSKIFQFKNDNNQISRWSGFLLAGIKGSLIFEYMRDILYAYWKDHTDQIDYLLYDYTIALGYDNIPFIKEIIDYVPCSNVDKFLLEKDLNTEYSREIFDKYLNITFHKLTWKKSFIEYTKNGKLTIYGYILNKFSNP